MAAPIYLKEGHNPAKELFDMLRENINELESACCATSRITKGGSVVGYGVVKVKKDLAADKAMATLKAIKQSVRGW